MDNEELYSYQKEHQELLVKKDAAKEKGFLRPNDIIKEHLSKIKNEKNLNSQIKAISDKIKECQERTDKDLYKDKEFNEKITVLRDFNNEIENGMESV